MSSTTPIIRFLDFPREIRELIYSKYLADRLSFDVQGYYRCLRLEIPLSNTARLLDLKGYPDGYDDDEFCEQLMDQLQIDDRVDLKHHITVLQMFDHGDEPALASASEKICRPIDMRAADVWNYSDPPLLEVSEQVRQEVLDCARHNATIRIGYDIPAQYAFAADFVPHKDIFCATVEIYPPWPCRADNTQYTSFRDTDTLSDRDRLEHFALQSEAWQIACIRDLLDSFMIVLQGMVSQSLRTLNVRFLEPQLELPPPKKHVDDPPPTNTNVLPLLWSDKTGHPLRTFRKHQRQLFSRPDTRDIWDRSTPYSDVHLLLDTLAVFTGGGAKPVHVDIALPDSLGQHDELVRIAKETQDAMSGKRPLPKGGNRVRRIEAVHRHCNKFREFREKCAAYDPEYDYAALQDDRQDPESDFE